MIDIISIVIYHFLYCLLRQGNKHCLYLGHSSHHRQRYTSRHYLIPGSCHLPYQPRRHGQNRNLCLLSNLSALSASFFVSFAVFSVCFHQLLVFAVDAVTVHSAPQTPFAASQYRRCWPPALFSCIRFWQESCPAVRACGIHSPRR